MERESALARSRAARTHRLSDDLSLPLQAQGARRLLDKALGAVGDALRGGSGEALKAPASNLNKTYDGTTAGAGDASGTVVRPTKRKERREFFSKGGTIREVDLSKEPRVAEAVNALYLQSSVIEHLSEVTPQSSAKDLKAYYRNHPDSKLLVAELNGEVVGAITIYPEEGMFGTKLNRLVRREDKGGLGIAHFLIREGLARSFADKDKGGFSATQVIIGVIIPKLGEEHKDDVSGYESARRAFKDFYFETKDERIEDRVVSWSNKEGRLVQRDVEYMTLKLRSHLFRWGNDVKRGTSLPEKRAA